MITANTIKEVHLNDVRHALKALKSATKPQLAVHTGLSVVTINSLTKTLLENGEILECKETKTNGGRPAAVYTINANYKLALLFSTLEQEGTDLITASVINILGEQVEPYQKFTELTIENLDYSISYYVEKYPALQLIAFALPAKVFDGKLIFCDYSSLNNFPLQDYLSQKYHVPVFIENDIRIAILGHSSKNKSLDGSMTAGIYFPQKYSAGVGMYINGMLLSGGTGVAAEIEFLPQFLDIDWKSRTYEQTIDLIKTVCIMYNPDKLILYDAGMTEEKFAHIQEIFLKEPYRYFRPEFLYSNSISEDYSHGLTQYALLHLQD